jgi:cellulose synthase (UDP-forming)
MGRTATATRPQVRIEPLPPSRRMRVKLAVARVTIVLAGLATLRYLWWRIFHTDNPAAQWFFWAFLCAEVLNFVETFLFYRSSWSATRYATPAPLASRSVDVFIATYDEPLELLRETVVCARSIRYPHQTYVLDDGNRPEVKQLAEQLGAGYIARSEREHAKAGNLNNALQQTKGEFIVTLDADHVPAPELIDELIGFFADDEIGIVQTNQDFYNLDSFQHLGRAERRFVWQQQELFYNVIQPGKDRHNATFYCGSPAILRRAALDDIGGFATGTITEDVHTGIRMQKKGWRVLYHNRTLARGLAPQTFVAFATQWRRWGRGGMQVMRTEWPCFSSSLTPAQRICYFSSFYYYWMGFQKLAFLLTPMICLINGVFPMVTTPGNFLLFFGPYLVLNAVASALLQGGWRGFLYSEQFNLLKISVMMESIGGFFSRSERFQVTPKGRSGHAKGPDVSMHVFLVVLLAVAIAFGGFRLLRAQPGGYLFWALAVNLFWAIFYLVLLVPLVVRAIRRRENRQSYRWPAQLDVAVNYSVNGQQGKAFARNLNRTGLSITTEQPLGINEGIALELQMDRAIQATGRVVRNHRFAVNGKTLVANGIQFEKIAPEDQDAISKYLFFQVGPKQGSLLRLTHTRQKEAQS